MNYYNEFDPDAAAWLGELVSAGNIPAGRIDTRSVVDVRPGDLAGHAQCHFFAGIGGWAYALKLAGWPESKPVWTASLPCQPFSVAGKGLGEADERHLWPVFRELVRECRPPIIFGEQVASADGRLWLSGVRADLEGMGYAVAAVDCCAAGIGAPHIRQRLYWTAIRLADAGCQYDERLGIHRELPSSYGETEGAVQEWERGWDAVGGGCQADRLSDGINPGLEGHTGDEHHRNEPGRVGEDATGSAPEGGSLERLGESNGDGREPWRTPAASSGHRGSIDATGGWSDFYLVQCRDGKIRRVGTGLFPLAHGLPRGVVPSGDPSVEEANASQEARKVRLKGYGNAIVPQLAAEFIRAVMDVLGDIKTH